MRENESGKSTLIEAITIVLKLNHEGGSQNFNFKILDSHSTLSDYLSIPLYNKPKTKFF